VQNDRHTNEWRTTNVGSNCNGVTYTPEGWQDAFWHWKSWVLQQERAGAVPRGTKGLVEQFDSAADTYASIVIDGIRLWTAAAAQQRGRGCHWIVCPARLLPEGLAGIAGRAPRPAFGKIKGIMVHHHSAFPDADPDPRLHGSTLLQVEWYVSPLSHQHTNCYHPRMLAPVIGARRGGARQLPMTIVPAAAVTPLELVVKADPRNAAAQVVLPANNDLYFMTAFGYEGPRV
jgi:hypothetical protein